MAESKAQGLETPIQYLKGVGPKLAMILKKLKLETVQDVLNYFPNRHEDRRNLPEIIMTKPGEGATVRGEVLKVSSRRTRGGKVMIKAILSDGTGQIDLVWFNQPWIGKELETLKSEIIAFGMVKIGEKGRLQISSPEWEKVDEEDGSDEFAKLVPVYPLTEGVHQWVVRRATESAVNYFASQVNDPLTQELLKESKMRSLVWSYQQIHYPESQTAYEKARQRFVFDEFFYLQLQMLMKKLEVQQEAGISFPISELKGAGASSSLFTDESNAEADLMTQVKKMLPFEMTGAQNRVIQEIWADMERPFPMNRLLQGDVGSGKTAVAAAAMLACARSGYQAAMMAPTEILAEQHLVNVRSLLEPTGISVSLLVGGMTSPQKKKVLNQIKSGEVQVVVGTHALIQDKVEFYKLGLAIVDEQHRFGVRQRMALGQKSSENPDVLVMTATPIPRTLTKTVYGDLDVSILDELPPGRKPIKTHHKSTDKRDSVYQSVREFVEKGRQAYFVCPMIDESALMQTQAAVDLHYRLSNEEFSEFKVGLLHGQMKPAEKEEVMESFRKGEIQILVSTVVIEVGVDVPNASIMVIEDANRFGLSQLHQLRGRVGRGSQQSYCVLIANTTTEDSAQRLKIMVETTDGFKIAEEDLKIRGQGDLVGTAQSGRGNFKVADLVKDQILIEPARQAALQVLERDPSLSLPEHRLMLNKLKEKRAEEALITVS